jgi:hypothetical protein
MQGNIDIQKFRNTNNLIRILPSPASLSVEAFRLVTLHPHRGITEPRPIRLCDDSRNADLSAISQSSPAKVSVGFKNQNSQSSRRGPYEEPMRSTGPNNMFPTTTGRIFSPQNPKLASTSPRPRIVEGPHRLPVDWRAKLEGSWSGFQAHFLDSTKDSRGLQEEEQRTREDPVLFHYREIRLLILSSSMGSEVHPTGPGLGLGIDQNFFGVTMAR